MPASSRSAVGRRRPGGPRRWTAADKRRHLAAFARQSGTIATYCAAAGVPRATFTLWQREARERRAAGPTPPAFARVAVVPPLPAAMLTLRLRRAAVEAEVTGLDAATLVTVLGAVLGARRR